MLVTRKPLFITGSLGKWLHQSDVHPHQNYDQGRERTLSQSNLETCRRTQAWIVCRKYNAGGASQRLSAHAYPFYPKEMEEIAVTYLKVWAVACCQAKTEQYGNFWRSWCSGLKASCQTLIEPLHEGSLFWWSWLRLRHFAGEYQMQNMIPRGTDLGIIAIQKQVIRECI